METRHRTVVSIEVDAADIKTAGEDISRAFDPKTIDAFEKSITRMTRALTHLATQTARVHGGGASPGGRGPTGGGSGQGGGGPAGGGAGGSGGSAFWPTATGTFAGTLAGNAFSRGMGALGQAASPGGGLIQSLSGAVPAFGSALGPMVGALQSLYQSFEQVQSSLTRSYGATGRTDAMAGLAAHYGVGPSESPGMMAELAARSGLKDSALGEAFGAQLPLEKVLGVRGAGSVVSAQMSGGGSVANPAELMKRSVGAGISAGIQENRLDQYLQNVSSWVERVRGEGIEFSVDSVNAMVRGFGSIGFGGENALRMATSLTGGAKDASRPGAGGASTGMAMRAALSVAESAGESTDLADLRLMLERGDPRIVDEIQRLIREDSGGDRNAAFGLLNAIAPGSSQADADRILANRVDLTKFEGGEADRAIRKRAGGFGGVSATSRHEADLELRRHAGGAQVAAGVQQRQNLELDLALKIAPEIARLVDEAVEIAMAALRAKGIGGAAKEVTRRGLNKFGGADAVPGGPGELLLGDAWEKGMEQGFGQSASEIMDTLTTTSRPSNYDQHGNQRLRSFSEQMEFDNAAKAISLPKFKAESSVPAPVTPHSISLASPSVKAPSATAPGNGNASGSLREAASFLQIGAIELRRGADTLDKQQGMPESAVGH